MRLYCHEDRFLVWQVRDLLVSRGIPCFVKNEYAIGAMGDLSPFDCWPEVWITDDEWMPKAKQLLDEWQSQLQQGSAWYCRHCGEENGSGFELCWQCDTERPDDSR
ncbi:DUF2007 domain-containing protein [Bowmanella sp. Y26]|nr:DUF2007 domain-containing protein [Bowmanella yangjiangensis]